MIYITGDMHGDMARFKSKEVKRLRKNDTLIVCGDFGFLWDGSLKEKRLLKWIGKRKYHVLFVEGTHDNLDLLKQYPVAEWNGGKVHEISGKLRHLCRGHVFEIEGLSILAFGGGTSTDSDSELEATTWWMDELPSEEELALARGNLAAHGNQVDYIVTHQCSRRIKHFLAMDHNDTSVLDAFLDEVREKVSYKRWFFGEIHKNKLIPPGEAALFRAVVPITAEKLLG